MFNSALRAAVGVETFTSETVSGLTLVSRALNSTSTEAVRAKPERLQAWSTSRWPLSTAPCASSVAPNCAEPATIRLALASNSATSQSPDPARRRAVTQPADGTVTVRLATLDPLSTPPMQLRADASWASSVVESSDSAEAGAAPSTSAATAAAVAMAPPRVRPLPMAGSSTRSVNASRLLGSLRVRRRPPDAAPCSLQRTRAQKLAPRFETEREVLVTPARMPLRKSRSTRSATASERRSDSNRSTSIPSSAQRCQRCGSSTRPGSANTESTNSQKRPCSAAASAACASGRDRGRREATGK